MDSIPSDSAPRPSGTWGLRLLIRLGAVALGILAYWLLGFLVQDIRSVPGPEYEQFAKRHVPADLTRKRETLQASIETLRREESARQETQRITADASHNLQRTMQQLIELQKLSTERQVALTDGDRANLAANLEQFLKFQTEYQALSAELAKLGEQRRGVEAETREVEKQIETLSQAAREEQAKAWATHRLKLAAGQLALLLPLLAGAGWLLARRKESPYLVAHLAVGSAILLKVVGVVHEYFPKRVFNYLLISAHERAPASLLAPASRLLAATGTLRWFTDHQHRVNVFVTNLRGPDAKVQLLGQAVEDLVPINSTSGNVRVAFGVFSYDDALTVTVVADASLCDELAELTDDLQIELDAVAATNRRR